MNRHDELSSAIELEPTPVTPWIMFTKHLEGWSLDQIIEGLKLATVQGADLCVRPGYPVDTDNVEKALPDAAKRFVDAGLSIPLVTTPGDFVTPNADYAERLFAGCAAAGVKLIKLGYWHMEADGYWATLDRCRKHLEGFAKLAEKHGVKPIVHNHSGASMGLNSCGAMNLMRGFDPNHVGVFADAGHLALVGEPVEMALDIVQEYLAAVAVKDLVKEHVTVAIMDETWGLDVRPLGSGFVNFPALIETLRKIDFTGPISFHCEYYRMPPESVIDQCRIDTRYIRALMGKSA